MTKSISHRRRCEDHICELDECIAPSEIELDCEADDEFVAKVQTLHQRTHCLSHSDCIPPNSIELDCEADDEIILKVPSLY